MTFRASVIEQLMMEAAAEGVDNSDIGTVEWLAQKLSEARGDCQDLRSFAHLAEKAMGKTDG